MGNRFWHSEKGVAMIMAIAFMALSVPLVTGALTFAGALSSDSVVKTDILKRQYAGLGIRDYVRYCSRTFQIETIDFAPLLAGGERERRATAVKLARSLRTTGFAILVGHGVDPNLFERAEREVERVFTKHTLAQKLRFRAERQPRGGYQLHVSRAIVAGHNHGLPSVGNLAGHWYSGDEHS